MARPPVVAERARVRIVRTAENRAGVLAPVLVQHVPVDGRQFWRQSEDVLLVKVPELVEQLLGIGTEHDVAIYEDASLHLRVCYSMQAQRQVEQRVSVVGT